MEPPPPLDRRRLPFRRPPGRVPDAAALALLAVVAVLGGWAVRLATVPDPAAVEEARFVVARLLPPRLAREPLYVWGDAEGGATVAARGPAEPQVGAGAASIIERTPPGTAVADAIRDAREEALALRWWELALLATGAAALIAATADRQVRYGPATLDLHGLRAGRVRVLWDDVASTRWATDHVEVRLRDGASRAIRGLALQPAEVAETQAVSDGLVARRAALEDPPAAKLERLLELRP